MCTLPVGRCFCIFPCWLYSSLIKFWWSLFRVVCQQPECCCRRGKSLSLSSDFKSLSLSSDFKSLSLSSDFKSLSLSSSLRPLTISLQTTDTSAALLDDPPFHRIPLHVVYVCQSVCPFCACYARLESRRNLWLGENVHPGMRLFLDFSFSFNS